MAKITVVSDDKPKFDPVTLSITVETLDEFLVLYSIFSSSKSEILFSAARFSQKVADYFKTRSYDEALNRVVWKQLNNLRIERNFE